MINKESIAKMRDGVIILNDSRGPLIVEEDLKEALNPEKVGAAGLDVVIHGAHKGDNPCFGARNCFITPHIAWAPRGGQAAADGYSSGKPESHLWTEAGGCNGE